MSCPLLTGQIVPRILYGMKSVNDVFRIWDSTVDMADDVGESHWTVSKWKQRKRIPQSAWMAVVQAAQRRGKKLTAENLLLMHGALSPSARAGLNK